jgi:actin related protein 2/3 complex subunit 2
LVTAEEKNIMKVSASVRGSSVILKNPVYRAVFDEYFGKYAHSNTENSYDITLAINLDELPSTDAEKEALATLLARIKRYILGAPLLAMGRALDQKAPLTNNVVIEVRSGEYIYFVPRPDRIVAIFDIAFKDPTDVAVAKVFMQGFTEMGRNKSFATAPQPLFMTSAPSEIADVPELKANNSPRFGFLSFGIQPRHVDAKSLDNTVDRFVQFRAYMHYHIKCSKSQMHTRMRKRVEHLLQVLNRAIPDTPKTGEARSFLLTGAGSAGI